MQGRAHFFGVAARAMRQILVEHARKRQAAKRGGDFQRVTLSIADRSGTEPEFDILDLEAALEELAALDERKARVLELRFFAGLTMAARVGVPGPVRAWPVMRWLLPLILVACSNGSPAVRPVPDVRELDLEGRLLVVHDAGAWERFLTRQPAEQMLRLRDLRIDFSRESFVAACSTATSGSTRVTFSPRFRDDGVLSIEVQALTPRGAVRNDLVIHCFAAVVAMPQLEAVLVDGS